jgi:hypothetical protein
MQVDYFIAVLFRCMVHTFQKGNTIRKLKKCNVGIVVTGISFEASDPAQLLLKFEKGFTDSPVRICIHSSVF